MNIFHSIWLGIQRHPSRFFVWIFLSYSALWTIIESVLSFFPDFSLNGTKYYCTLIGLSVVLASIRSYQKKSIEFRIKHTNTKIRVLFGDIFCQNGFIAIPVNEFFDSEIGLPVSPNSLHGIVIDRYFGGHPASFDKLIETDLKGAPVQNVARGIGKTNKYEIGTTALIQTNTHRFLLFALCLTDIDTCKASASLEHLIAALKGLCAKARVTLGGEKLIIPLAGSGLAIMGLPPQHLLHIIILTLLDETKRNQFASEIEIVLHSSRFDEIDLSMAENIWR
jgi:hypothetical protein